MMKRSLCWLSILLCLFNVSTLSAQSNTMGSNSCASSTCHGGVVPWEGSNILGNEFITWSRLDKHRNAAQLLFSSEAKSISKKLGLTKPAHQTTSCLNCHAQNPSLHTANTSEGISCESCHGPAANWINSHKNSSHKDNIKRGMYPTNNPASQAKLCLSCHLGKKNQFVTHRMMAAGHPRLNFELSTFTAIQPPHYVIDQDWHQRKGEYNPTKSWAVGQVIASQFILNSFADPEIGSDGIFPELVLFDCHACHRLMSEKRGAPRWDIGPGRIRLNDSHFLMLRAILNVVNQDYFNEFNQKISGLQASISAEHDTEAESPQKSAEDIAKSLDKYIVAINKQPLDKKQLKNIFLALIADSSAGQFSDPSGAEQAYMAISNLAAALSRTGGLKSIKSVNSILAEMRQNLADDDQYQSEMFALQLANLKKTVSEEK
jgi:hypothetical protein